MCRVAWKNPGADLMNDLAGIDSGVDVHEGGADEFRLALHERPEIRARSAVVGRQAKMNIEEAAFETRKQRRPDEGAAITGQEIGAKRRNVLGMPGFVDLALGDEYRRAAIRCECDESAEEVLLGTVAGREVAHPQGVRLRRISLDDMPNAFLGPLAIAACH